MDALRTKAHAATVAAVEQVAAATTPTRAEAERAANAHEKAKQVWADEALRASDEADRAFCAFLADAHEAAEENWRWEAKQANDDADEDGRKQDRGGDEPLDWTRVDTSHD